VHYRHHHCSHRLLRIGCALHGSPTSARANAFASSSLLLVSAHKACNNTFTLYFRITILVARLQFLSSVHVPVLAMVKISPSQKRGSSYVAITSCPRLSSYSTKGGIIESWSVNLRHFTIQVVDDGLCLRQTCQHP
jgi:hypothetical protein